MTTFVGKVEEVERALTSADVPHAFGGALALAYCVGEPRATADIDVNVFLEPGATRQVFEALPAGVSTNGDLLRAAVRDGQVRLWWDDTAVDLFFSYHPFHDFAQSRARRVPFGEVEIPVLACTDLAVFKVVFNRTKDWADIEAMIESSAINRTEALSWLQEILGEDSEPVGRLTTLRAHRSAADPLRDAFGSPPPRSRPPQPGSA